MNMTFDDIGTPFRLYRGPIELCSEYIGQGQSVLSNLSSEHCFKLDVGCCLVLNCTKCNFKNYLDCGDQENTCQSCGAEIIKLDFQDIIVTYKEIRDGFALITKDTEIGMISWKQLQSGYTNGSPRKDSLAGFEIRQKNDGWYEAKVNYELMYELLRTPNYVTWQGERWMFHDGKPMIYCGEWTDSEFDSARGELPLKTFYEKVLGSRIIKAYDHRNSVNKYIFKSEDGNCIKGHFDFD